MFKDKKSFSLEKYQSQRRGKISFFGISADFDWFLLNILLFLLFVFVFIYSIDEINTVLNYEPELDLEYQSILRDKKVTSDLDDIISSIGEREDVSQKDFSIDEMDSE